MLVWFADVSSTINAVEPCLLPLSDVLAKIPVGYDVTTEETFSVWLEEFKVGNCTIVFVTEIRFDDNTDSELCLVAEGLEFSNVIYIV